MIGICDDFSELGRGPAVSLFGFGEGGGVVPVFLISVG